MSFVKMTKGEKITSYFKPINREQERVIKKLEEVLNLFRCIQIKNEKSLSIIHESLDALLSNLKYLPTNPSFDILPTEIKTDIFSYLCDTGAFVMASVSQEWRNIMEKRLKEVEEVNIGLHCSNEYECEDNECFMPEEILKASSVLKSDIPLTICHPLPNTESELIIDGLASASNISIEGLCSCVEDDENEDDENYEPVLTGNEFRRLFEVLSLKSEVMNSVKLIDLKLSSLNQDRLLDCLLNNTHSLTLDGGEFHSDALVSGEKLVKKLLQVSEDSKLVQLNIYRLDLDDFSDVREEDMADALCTVYSVHWIPQLHPEPDMIRRLTENILNRQILQVTMRKIKIEPDEDDQIKWSTLIEPEDLKTFIDNMTAVDLTGEFSQEQVEALTFLPDVQASLDRIVKGEF